MSRRVRATLTYKSNNCIQKIDICQKILKKRPLMVVGGDGGSYNERRRKTGGTKVVIFRGIYCGFGALMGAPMVPDGGYGAPGH